MKYALPGKVCVITGATSGLGAGITAYFSTLECTLVLVANDSAGLERIKGTCISKGLAKDKIYTIDADLSIDVKASNAFKRIGDAFKKIDILINVGGDIKTGNLTQISSDVIQEVMNENVTSVTLAIKCAASYMKREEGATSVVINISSICPQRMIQGYLAFGMAKSSLDYLTKCLAIELAPKKIRVNAVSAGIPIANLDQPDKSSRNDTEKEVLSEAKKWNPLGYPCSVEDIAHAAAYMASDSSSFISGDILTVDAGRHIASIM